MESFFSKYYQCVECILGVFQPESVGSDAIVAWVDFWCRTYSANETVSPETEEPPPGALISSSLWQVLTPKQLLLLAQSTSPRDSWNHVTTLLLQLLKSGLVRYKDVQEQAVAVVRQEWPQVHTLKQVCFYTNVSNITNEFDFVVFPRSCWGDLQLAFATLLIGIGAK